MDSIDFHMKTLQKDLILLNLKSIENKSRQILQNSVNSNKSFVSLALCQLLFTHANLNCKRLKWKEAVAIRKLVDKLKIEVPDEVYLRLSYEFLNYYSCALRDLGFLYKAKIVADRAIELVSVYKELDKSDALMNMCAILSTSGKHLKAFDYAKSALKAIKSELKGVKAQGNKEKIREKYVKVAIAYFNLAVEEEFCGYDNPALFNYENCKMILEINHIDEDGFLEKVNEAVKRMRKIRKEKENISLRAKSHMKILDSRKETPSSIEPRNKYSRIQSARKNEEFKTKPKIEIQKKIAKNLSSKRLVMKVSRDQSLKKVETEFITMKTDDFSSFDKKSSKSFLQLLVKIQAFVKGSIMRERFRLLKKGKGKILMKRLKIIENSLYVVKTSTIGYNFLVEVFNQEKKFSMIIPETRLDEIYKRVWIQDDKIILKSSASTVNNILEISTCMQDVEYCVKYSQCGKKLIIVMLNNTKTLQKEIMLSHDYNRATAGFIIEKIHPKLSIINDSISLLDFYCTVKAFIPLNNTLSLVNIIKTETEIQYFLDSVLLLSLPLNSCLSFPEYLYIKSKKSNNTQIFKQRSESSIRQVYKEKLLLNNGFEYFIIVYLIQDKKNWFFFDAVSEDAPKIIGTSYFKIDLKKMFGFNIIENNLYLIIKKLILVNEVLDLRSAVTNERMPNLDVTMNIEKVIVKIQAVYRGNRTRDMLKLQRFNNKLIISVSKLIEACAFNIKIYKSSSSYLVEVIKLQNKSSFYFFIKDPLEYVTMFFRFNHLNLLINAMKLKDLPYIEDLSGKRFNFVECEYDPEEISATASLLHKVEDELIILGLVFPNKSIIAKIYDYKHQVVHMKKYALPSILELIGKYDIEAFLSSFKIVSGSVSHSMSVVIRPNNLAAEISDKVLYRTCIKFIEVLYQVSVYQDGELLRFVYKRGSNMGLGIEFTIPLKVACERSGFPESLLIPMVNYFIKSLLVMKDDEVVMNSKKSIINFEKIICKIQAVFRSFLLRKKMKGNSMRLLLKVKKPEKETIYTILLFENLENYLLFGVNLSEVFKKVIKKHRGDTPETVLKAHINDLFIIRDNSKKLPHTLKFATKIKTFLTEPGLSNIVLYKEKGIINNQSALVTLYDLGACEQVECKIDEKVYVFEISSNYMPRSEKIFKMIEINDKGDLVYYIPQRKIMYFQSKAISGHHCQIYLCTKAKKFQIIIFMIKNKKYFIRPIGKKIDMVKFMDRVKLIKDHGSYSVSY